MTRSERLRSEAPRDIANEVEGMILGIPQTILAHVLHLSLKADGDAIPAPRVDRFDAIIRAKSFLQTEFQSRFTMAGGTLSDPLLDATTKLGTALESVMAQMPGPDRPGDRHLFVLLAEKTETSVAPAVVSFLATLFDQVVEAEKASAKRAHEFDSQALSQIDSISRQINSIAVNAAVEAARVGAAGRGFAVIAAEIKSLSQQAQKAVERIRQELG